MSFFKNVGVIFRGALIGQIIPVIAMPFISRAYPPEQYGIYGSIMSLGVIFATISTLQLEVAVVLPKNENQARDLARSILAISLYTTGALIALMALFLGLTHAFDIFDHLSWWLVSAPILSYLMGAVWLTNYTAIRHQYYAELGNSAATLQIGFCGAAIAGGFLAPSIGMLAGARILGQLFAIATYRKSLKWLFGIIREKGWANLAAIRETIRTYPKFVYFSTPYAFVSSLSREVVSVILLFFNHPAAAGYYTLARSILLMPSSLLSTSLGQIFYHEASKSLHRPEFQSFIYRLMFAIAGIIAPACVYIAEWGPEIFGVAFGRSWMDAGTYAMLFMPVALLYTLTVWVTRVFEVAGKQDILFRMLLAFDAISISVLTICLVSGWAPDAAVGAYVGCQIVYFLVYLGVIFRLIGFSAVRYAMLISAAIGCGTFAFLIRIVSSALFDERIGQFVSETLATGLFCGLIAFGAWQKIKGSPFLHKPVDGVNLPA